MKNFFTSLMILAILACPALLSADTVFLKSGEKINGKIVVLSAQSTWVQTENGAYKEYPSAEIERVEKDIEKPEENIERSEKGSEELGKNSEKKTEVRKIKEKIEEKPQLIDQPQYLLYIPKGIDSSRKYPLVVALYPTGNAEFMIQALREVAEEFKWIIFASKEFKNGIGFEPVMSHMANTIENLSMRLPIDRSRIVATGLSGGGMGSHGFAFAYPKLISAVIINTGKMHEDFIKQKNVYPKGKIAVFLASPTDFRYNEMKQDRIFLESLGWKTKWIEFQGGHTMAPGPVYKQAAQWLIEQWR